MIEIDVGGVANSVQADVWRTSHCPESLEPALKDWIGLEYGFGFDAGGWSPYRFFKKSIYGDVAVKIPGDTPVDLLRGRYWDAWHAVGSLCPPGQELDYSKGLDKSFSKYLLLSPIEP